MPGPPIALYQRRAAAVAVAIVVAVFGPSPPGAGAEFTAGGYTFSDELGGFRLLSATGSGTPDDPVVIAEEIFEVAPVTLVIRNHDLGGGFESVRAQFTMVKRVANRSNRVWAGFELELQEVQKKPSVYSDGLSFKQFSVMEPDVSSDSFTENERRFEPYDRIEFSNGHVDPGATAEFKITITDPTPVREFYIVQDPKLLAAELPSARRGFAALQR